jgi:hypothetical protein
VYEDSQAAQKAGYARTEKITEIVGDRRNHQIPAHKREHGGVTGLHLLFLEARIVGRNTTQHIVILNTLLIIRAK